MRCRECGYDGIVFHINETDEKICSRCLEEIGITVADIEEYGITECRMSGCCEIILDDDAHDGYCNNCY